MIFRGLLFFLLLTRCFLLGKAASGSLRLNKRTIPTQTVSDETSTTAFPKATTTSPFDFVPHSVKLESSKKHVLDEGVLLRPATLIKHVENQKAWPELQPLLLQATGSIDALQRSQLFNKFANGEMRGGTVHETAKPEASCQTNSEFPVVWNDAACSFYVVQGGLQVCGDLKVNGRLVVLSDMDLRVLLEGFSQQIRMRCSKGERISLDTLANNNAELWVNGNSQNRQLLEEEIFQTTESSSFGEFVAGSLVVPNSDVYIAGPLEIGKSLFAQSISVNTGGDLLAGLEPLAKWFADAARKAGVSSYFWQSELHSTIIREFACPVVDPYGVIIAPSTDVEAYIGLSSDEVIKQRTKEGESPKMENIESPAGDISAGSGKLILANAGRVLAFGNVQGDSVILDDGASLHAFCGHAYTNTSDGAGIAALDGSVLTLGGLFESQSIGLSMQDSASAAMRGGFISVHHTQVDESSLLSIGSSLFTPILAVDDQSVVTIEGSLDSPLLVEAIDGGKISVLGNATVGALQSFDGGQITVGSSSKQELPEQQIAREYSPTSGLFVKDFAVIDASAVLKVNGGHTFVNNSFHVSNSSSFELRGGDLIVNGTTRVVTAAFTVDGNVLSTSSVLIGLSSHFVVAQNLIAAGVTASDLGLVDQMESEQVVNASSSSDPARRALYSTQPMLSRRKLRMSSPFRNTNHSIPSLSYMQLFDDINNLKGNYDDGNNNNYDDANDIIIPWRRSLAVDGENSFAGENETEGNSTVDPTEVIGQPLPAVFSETAQIVVGGQLIAKNSWVEFGKGSNVAILGVTRKLSEGASEAHTWAIAIQRGMLLLDGGSILNVTQKGVSADVGISLEQASAVFVPNGHVSAAFLDVADRSVLTAQSMEFSRDVFVSGRSLVHMTGVVEGNLEDNDFVEDENALRFGGSILAVDEGSYVIAPALEGASGDVFVEDGSLLKTVNGGLKTLGFVVVQDRGRISSARNITSLKGDVVAENSAKIIAQKGVVEASSGSIRATPQSSILTSNAQVQQIMRYYQRTPDELINQLLGGSGNNATNLEAPSTGMGNAPAILPNPDGQPHQTGSWDRWAISPEAMKSATSLSLSRQADDVDSENQPLATTLYPSKIPLSGSHTATTASPTGENGGIPVWNDENLNNGIQQADGVKFVEMFEEAPIPLDKTEEDGSGKDGKVLFSSLKGKNTSPVFPQYRGRKRNSRAGRK